MPPKLYVVRSPERRRNAPPVDDDPQPRYPERAWGLDVTRGAPEPCCGRWGEERTGRRAEILMAFGRLRFADVVERGRQPLLVRGAEPVRLVPRDRKSTRLNSSH